MSRSDAFVSLVAVVHNDVAIVDDFVQEALAMLAASFADYELIVVDDASEDETAARVHALLSQHPGLRLIRLTCSHGYDVAVAAGMDSAVGDCVVVLAAESDPLDRVPEFVELARRKLAIVVGRGSHPRRPIVRRVTGWLAKGLFGLEPEDLDATFYAFPHSAVQSLTREKSKVRYLPTIARRIGFRHHPLAYRQMYRVVDRVGAGWRERSQRLLRVAMASSVNPLRLVSHLSLIAAGVNLLYAVYVVAVNILMAQVAEGWTTLSLQVSGLFLCTFLILMMIAEYLGFILEETRDRPLYHVLEEKSSEVPVESLRRHNVVALSLPAGVNEYVVS
jgi:glycosyltransferase involved in cell wall biosynthesis